MNTPHKKGGEITIHNLQTPEKAVKMLEETGLYQDFMSADSESLRYSIFENAEEIYKKGVFEKGGKTISREDIVNVLKDELEDVLEDANQEYEGQEITGEEVEYKSRDGFIPYTDGGYEYRFFAYGNHLTGSGKSLPTNTLDAELERVENLNYEYGKERFAEDYPEIVKELGEENIDYDSLSEAGYDSEADDLDNFSISDDDSIMFEVEAFYYNPDNDKGIDGKHTIVLSGSVNMEAPYHRTGNYEDYTQDKFTFDSIEDLKEKLQKGIDKISKWFDGENYKEGRELKMGRFAKGGSIGETNSIVNGLKKGDTIEISFGSSISNTNKVALKVRSRNKVRKGRVDKITFENINNPQSSKFYAYERGDGKWGFAMGDMAISNISITKSYAKGGKTAKYKAGDKVYYLPKLSGFDNSKPLTVKYVNYEKDSLSESMGIKTTPKYKYNFENSSLGAVEDDLSKRYAKGGVTEKDQQSIIQEGSVIEYVDEDGDYSADIGYRDFYGKNMYYIWFNGTIVHSSITYKSMLRKLNQLKEDYNLEYRGVKYEKGGSIRRTNNSSLLRYTNFEDGWIFNLVKLNPFRNNDGLRYKGNVKYGISRSGPGKKQEIWQFENLKEANKKYDELVELGKTYSKIERQGKIESNYAKGGEIDLTKEYYNVVAMNENYEDLGYNSNSTMGSQSEAIEQAKEWFSKGLEPMPNTNKRRKVGIVEVFRIRLFGNRFQDENMIYRFPKRYTDLIYRVNETYPLGERVVQKPIEENYGKGGAIDVKIKDWYTKNYPKDELGERMNNTNTFEDLSDALNKGDNVYNVTGVGDSLIRERLFEHLAKVKGVEYKFIYEKWLGKGMITDEEIKSMFEKGGEVKKKENEMLIGGLAGILLGIFLNK